MQAFQGLIVVVLLAALYFLPYIVARKRRHKNAEAIGILNLLLGWTGIGWIIALIWSSTSVKTS